jgi:hypothetical protein
VARAGWLAPARADRRRGGAPGGIARVGQLEQPWLRLLRRIRRPREIGTA